MIKDKDGNNLESPIHGWFELSYASYLTVPRIVLESMPYEWQKQFTALLEDLDESIDWRPDEGRYWVQLRGSDGRYRYDPLCEYRHAPKLPLIPKPEKFKMEFIKLGADDEAVYMAASYPYPTVEKELVNDLLPVDFLYRNLQYHEEESPFELRMDNPAYPIKYPGFMEIFATNAKDSNWHDWFLITIPHSWI